MNKNKKNLIKPRFILAGFLLFFCVCFFVDLNPEKPTMTMTLAVTILMAVLWITEAIPMAVTSLLPIVLFPMLGILDGKTVSGTYVNYIIFLFLGGFIMALALEKWNLHQRIALKILIWLGSSPLKIIIGFMVATAFLSMWISNTATTMMMVPIAFSVQQSLSKYLDATALKSLSTALLLSIAYSASVGGTSTLVGTAPNLSFVRIFEILYPEGTPISFSNWMLFATPITLLMLCAIFGVLYFLFPIKNTNQTKVSKDIFKRSYEKLGRMSTAEKRVLLLFGALIFLWIFRKPIQIGDFTLIGWSSFFGNPKWLNDGTTAIFIAVLLFMIPSEKGSKTALMDWEVSKKFPWDIVLLLGGGFALAKGFTVTGLADYIGGLITDYAGTDSITLMISGTTLMSLATEFTSNTATTEMLLPIIGGIAKKAAIHPLLLMLPVTLAASMAFMFPVATPPNAIVFGTGQLKIKDMVKAGIVLNTIAVLLVCLLTVVWGAVVFGGFSS